MQIIGIGLCGVFELIKETRFSHPSLCLRSLQALLDMLQGQQPEGFQTEPPDVLGKAENTLRRVYEVHVNSLMQFNVIALLQILFVRRIDHFAVLHETA